MIPSHTKFFITIFSIIAALLLGVIIFGTYSIRAQSEEASNLLNLADKRAEEESLVQSIRAIQSGVGANIKDLDALVLTSDKLVSLIESIEGAGKSLGVATSILSVNKLENKNATEHEPQVINIVVQGVGSWAKNISFTQAIENLPHRVMIDEVGLYKSDKLWQSRISISLYSFNK